ncbi:MAG TPA: TylF/MycF/NovP-related O-methyltransferase [Acetobacteraceae bacterium]|jgi:hypothetical protein|nr:TylF/MycF/NovP-related O-methyltransferase [Acetobacteraceae bacterium]
MDQPIGKLNREISGKSIAETELDRRLLALTQDLVPQFGHQWNQHTLVSMKRQTLARLVYYHDLYRMILDVPGVLCEFGVQWGATLATLINLRGMYEPYNASRTIVGFDTFEGFAAVDAKDGARVAAGDYATRSGYENTLAELLALHEANAPLAHLRRFALVKGDAATTVRHWLEANPHAIVAMAIFDMDLYAPTREVLLAIMPRLTIGSVLVFDEMNHPGFPGETVALRETLGLHRLSLRRMPHQSYGAWCVYGG